MLSQKKKKKRSNNPAKAKDECIIYNNNPVRRRRVGFLPKTRNTTGTVTGAEFAMTKVIKLLVCVFQPKLFSSNHAYIIRFGWLWSRTEDGQQRPRQFRDYIADIHLNSKWKTYYYVICELFRFLGASFFYYTIRNIRTFPN